MHTHTHILLHNKYILTVLASFPKMFKSQNANLKVLYPNKFSDSFYQVLKLLSSRLLLYRATN